MALDIARMRGGPSGIAPGNAHARARAISWMFAALSMVEPQILDRETTRLAERDEPWAEQRLRLAYVARGEARPAYRRAFDAQLADFTTTSTG